MSWSSCQLKGVRFTLLEQAESQALVFVGFDLVMKLEGLKKWGDLCRKGVEERKHVDGCSEPSRLLE
jgi:hypothetical protein